jgi:hypothetical protein
MAPNGPPGAGGIGKEPGGLNFGSNILPPHLRAPGALNLGSSIMQFPPLEPLLPQALKDFSPLPKMPTAPVPVSSVSNDPAANKESSANEKQDKEQKIIRINDDSEDGLRDKANHSSDSNDVRADREKSQDSSQSADKSQTANAAAAAAASEDLQRLQSMIMELNGSKAVPGNETGTQCKICNKDMENKYFLRAHMMNEHGVLHTEEPPQFLIDPTKHGQSPQEGDKPPNPFPSLINGNGDSSQPGAAAAAADFASKFLQQMQKGLGSNFNFDEGELSFLERVKSELSGSPKKLDKDPNRKPASLSRSYCEICKKELCNKYFMKTHMMKMHGINIEATNTPGGVSCHLCNKELCSKYFLKVHLQNSHGINEDGSPVPPNMREGAPAGGPGGGLFGGLFPPPPEMLGLPSSPDKDRYFSRLLGEQSEASRERMKELERQKQQQQQMLGPMGQNGQKSGAESSAHTCSLCGEDFPEIVALQVHIIKSHGAFPPESGVFGGDKRPSSREGSELEAEKERGTEADKDGADFSKEAENATDREQPNNNSSSSTNANSPVTSMSSAFPFPWPRRPDPELRCGRGC